VTQVVESTVYDDLMHLIKDEPPPSQDDPRIKQAKDYPFTLKVHINERGDCDKLAELLGRNLSSDETKIRFSTKAKRATGCRYFEKRQNPLKLSTAHRKRDEALLWGSTTDFRNDPTPLFQTFEITLGDVEEHIAFLRLIKQQLSFDTSYTYFPQTEKAVSKGSFWISKFEDHQPRYPLFIVSKGRAFCKRQGHPTFRAQRF